MFDLARKHKVLKFNEMMECGIDDIIGDKLSSVLEESHQLVQYLTESQDFSKLRDSNLYMKFMNIIDDLIQYIVSIYNRFILIFESKLVSYRYIIDKYESKISDLPDDAFKNIIYEYREYNITSDIPGRIDRRIISKYGSKFLNNNVNEFTLNEFKDNFDIELSFIRGQILNKTSRIESVDFENSARKVFKPSNEVFIKHLNKSDLLKIMADVKKYKELENSIIQSQKIIIDECNVFKKILDDINTSYSDFDNNSKAFVEINEYKNLYNQFIIEIINSYSVVFKEKINALRERFEMDYSVLKQVIYLVQ